MFLSVSGGNTGQVGQHCMLHTFTQSEAKGQPMMATVTWLLDNCCYSLTSEHKLQADYGSSLFSYYKACDLLLSIGLLCLLGYMAIRGGEQHLLMFAWGHTAI